MDYQTLALLLSFFYTSSFVSLPFYLCYFCLFPIFHFSFIFMSFSPCHFCLFSDLSLPPLFPSTYFPSHIFQALPSLPFTIFLPPCQCLWSPLNYLLSLISPLLLTIHYHIFNLVSDLQTL